MIFISTSNFTERYQNGLHQIIENLPHRFSCYEIGSNHASTFDDLKFIQRIQQERRYSFLLHNYPFREKNNLMIDLAEEDKNKRQLILDYLRKMLEFTAALGGDYFSLHAGYTKSVGDKEGYKRSLEFFLEGAFYLNEFAKQYRVKIGIENHSAQDFERDTMLFCQANDFEYLFRSIDDQNLCLHIDIGHLKIAAHHFGFSSVEFIHHFQDKIYAVHLHDNDAINDFHLPITQENNMIKALKKLERLKYWVLESWNQDVDSLIEQVSIIS